MRGGTKGARTGVLLLLAVLLLGTLAQNNKLTTSDNYQTGTYHADSPMRAGYEFTYWESGIAYTSMVYTVGVWGSGTEPRSVAYHVFDFRAVAPNPSRFCATGQPKIFVHFAGGGYVDWVKNPIIFDVPSTLLDFPTLTWNTQPSLSSYISRATAIEYPYSHQYGYVPRAPRSYANRRGFYRIALSATFINAAVHQRYDKATIRHSHASDIVTNWSTHMLSEGTLKPYLLFDYTTCHTNAQCVNDQCVCNQHYSGSGATCTYTSCDPTTVGNANFPLTLTGVVAYGTCATGYQLGEGTPAALCSESVWSSIFNPCVPTTCSADNSGSVGFARYPLTNAGNTATGSCISGYTGSASRLCQSNGQWAATATVSCSRIKCPAASMGNANFPATDSMTTGSGVCIGGYSGTPTSACSDSGTWGTVVNACTRTRCTELYDTVNNANWPATDALLEATGTCFAGFEGAPKRACQADGAWAAAITGSCVQITCSVQQAFKNADWPSTAAGTTATGTCVSGYGGTTQRPCKLDGTWSDDVSPTCARNVCAADTFGNATWPANTLSMTSAVGTCVAGFTGTPSRACNADGSWASSITNPCVQLFCSSAQQNDANWPHTAAGTANVTGECVSGYSGSPVRGCDLNGNWLSVTVPCTRNRCEAVTEGFANWTATDSLTSVSATCQAGYHGSPSRTCGADGTFGEIINPCQRIVCSAHNQDNAQWPDTDSGYTANGVCDLGSVGSPTRNCSMTGLWGAIVSPCVRITCAATNDSSAYALFPVANAGDSNVAGSCYDGMSGFPARDCFYNGTWSESRNPCSTTPCPALRNNGNADWESPDDVNQLVNGTCVAGYNTSLPAPQRMCNLNGQWATEITNPCQPLFCTKTSPSYSPFNAEWPESVQAGFSASGTCVAGYSGMTSRMCLLTGEWGTPSPACQPIQCAAIGNDGAHSSWPQTQAGQSASGTCLAGYEGAPTRLCSITGQWEEVSSPCAQKKCPAGTISNSMWNETLGGLSATGICVPGTTGTVTRSCSTDGIWGPVIGSCVGLLCPAETVDNAEWLETPQGNVATGSCVNGYGSVSTPSRPCLENGVWGAITGDCVRLQCNAETFDNAEWPQVDSMTDGIRGTCVAGWQGAPLRNCSAAGLYSAVSNPCVRMTCPPLENASGVWPSVNAGTSDVQGTCMAGYDGTPVRNCAINGTWSAIVSGECVARSCQAETAGQVSWPTTPAGGVAGGSCSAGYSGSPSRSCSSVGEWEAIVNPCVQNICPAVTDGHVEWPSTPALSLPVEGVCELGYYGNPTRSCDADGNWGAISNPCAQLLCPSVYDGNANWSPTPAGQNGVGNCTAGYEGTPTRACLADGSWNMTIVNPCRIAYDDCPSSTVGVIFFPRAEPGETVNGTCPTDFKNSENGPPYRQCYANGTWEAEYSNPCVLIPVDASGTLSNLKWVSKTSTEVSLAWTAINMTENTAFRVEIAVGTSAFAIANSGNAVGLTTPSAVVKNLFPNTDYLFRVAVGDNTGYDEVNHLTLAVKTYITPATSLTLDAAENDALTFSWTPSPQAEYYESYYRAVGVGARAATDGFTFSERVDASVGTMTVSSLEPGRTYEVLLLSGLNNVTEQVGARLTVSTKSLTDNIIEDPGLGASGTIIVAASVSAVVVLLVIVIIVVVVMKRRQTRSEKIFEKYGGVESLESLQMYNKALVQSRSSMSHASSTTIHLQDAHRTVVNTALEIALPGFLRADYNSSVRPGARLPGSRAFAATLLDVTLSQRTGTSSVVVKKYVPNPAVSEEVNTERFHTEVALMWSLSFHPNVISLVAYTDEPRAIITRRYETDLASFLHNEGDQSPLSSAQLHHLAAGISSGLVAFHSLHVAHRDLRSSNILLQAPSGDSKFLTPIISGFNASRSAEDDISTLRMTRDMRYASPLVFDHVAHRYTFWPVEEDMESDMYSFGVLLWEMCERRMPWENMTDEDIGSHVTHGHFLEVNGDSKDSVRFELASIMRQVFVAETSDRPSASLVNARINALAE